MGTSIVDFRNPVAAEDSSPAAGRVLAGRPRAQVQNHYADGSGRFFAGRWSSTRGRWRVSYTEHEFCHLLEGRVLLTDDAGGRWEFGPGDAWVIPAGFSGTWETVEPASKLYAIFDSGAGTAT
ncbi:MAG: cupin domain-containing protein [Gammaproteobacteria bacterium]|nr:cupin domain-containing protein [Gammaproteobacteria bacterium]